jgi:hypothetical protein
MTAGATREPHHPRHAPTPRLGPLCHGPCNNPASPAPSLPRRVLDARRSANPRATAPCLRSPLLPLPRRRCATALVNIRPFTSLRLAGGYRVTSGTAPEAAPLALSLLLPPSRWRRLFSVRAFSRTARRLRHQLRSWLRRLRRGAVRRPALRGPPPLTCGEADGCAGGAWQAARSKPCHLLIAHPFGGYAAGTLPRPTLFLLHSAGRTPQRQTRYAGLPVKSHSRVSSLRSNAHRRAGVNSPLRGEL